MGNTVSNDADDIQRWILTPMLMTRMLILLLTVSAIAD
jgi:hypothetical protein